MRFKLLYALVFVLVITLALAEPTEVACGSDEFCQELFDELGSCVDGYCHIGEDELPEDLPPADNELPLDEDTPLQDDEPPLDEDTPPEDLPPQEENVSEALNQSQRAPLVGNALAQPRPNQTIPQGPSPQDLALRRDLTTLQGQVTQIDNTLNAVHQSQTGMNTRITSLENTINQAQSQNEELKSNLENQVNSINTGMAGLQQGLDSTQETVDEVKTGLNEEKNTSLAITVALVVLFSALIALSFYLYRNSNSTDKELNVQIVRYITQQTQTGKKFPKIKQELLDAGWHQDDVIWAYQETMKHNFSKYQTRTSPSSNNLAGAAPSLSDNPMKPDKHKILFIVGFSILVIVAAVLILKGVSTGNAIHFVDDQELGTAASLLLERKVTQSEFYPLIEEFNVCVEIHDFEQQASLQFLKTPERHILQQFNGTCNPNFDFVVKFTSFKEFRRAVQGMSCGSFQRAHETIDQAERRGVYVLPSHYVGQGMNLNPEAEYEQFCPLLAECFNEEQIQEMGIGC